MSSDLTFHIKNEKGSSKVLFSCNRNDFDAYFNELTDEILAVRDCAIYYFEDLDYYPEDIEDYKVVINQFDLIIIPVSLDFITDESRSRDIDFKVAIEERIPLLPILVQPGLYDLFNQLASVQVLDRTADCPTQEPYKEKLKRFVDSVLVDSETSKKIKDAFDAYIFLSYRKKDRKYAQEVMTLIHQNEFMRDVAIWYDEFLTPGEDFNDEIFENLLKSKVMALVVTPNINERYGEKGNYVIEEEYPRAIKENKTVVPIESIKTDKGELKSNFKDITDPISKSNSDKVEEVFRDLFYREGIKENDDPVHLYYIGLAYLYGIDVEKNIEKALSILDKASANRGVEASSFLSKFFEENEYYLDWNKAIEYGEKALEIAKEEYERTNSNEALDSYGLCSVQLTDILFLIGTSETIIKHDDLERRRELDQHIRVINSDYWNVLKTVPVPKEQLIGFMVHCFKTQNTANEAKDLIEELNSLDPDCLSTQTPDYYDVVLKAAADYDTETFFSDGEIDYDSSLFKVAIEKSKFLSDDKLLETLIRAWNFYDTDFIDANEAASEVEDICDAAIKNMFINDPAALIPQICYHGWFLDSEFCYETINDISRVIQNDYQQYANSDPDYMGALIEFFDKRRDRDFARVIFNGFIKKIDECRTNNGDMTRPMALMSLVRKWDESVPFYKSVLMILKDCYQELNPRDQEDFREYMVKSYNSYEMERDAEFAHELESFLVDCLDYRFGREEIQKYNEMFLIAERIPEKFAIRLLEKVVEGYKQLVGNKGKTIVAEKRLEKLKAN